MRRLAVVLALAGCGAGHRVRRELPDPPVGTLASSEQDQTSVHRPAIANGTFAAAFPGAPLAVRVRALEDSVIAPDQRGNGGQVELDQLVGMFSTVGVWTDPDGVQYLAAVGSMPDRVSRDAQGEVMERPLWFSRGQQLDPAWRVWPERGGRGSLIAFERGGEVVAVRHVLEVYRVRPVSIEPAVPMVLVEIADTEVKVAQRFEVIGYRDGALIELLSVEAAHTAFVIDRGGAHATVLPAEQRCSTAELANEGCTAKRTDYVWSTDRFVETTRSQRVRLVDANP